MYCPRCEQGVILQVRVMDLDEVVYLCDECNAMWHNKEHISAHTFKDYQTYVRSKGLKGAWSELMVLSENIDDQDKES